MKRVSLLSVVILLFFSLPAMAKRRFKYSLSPNQAEQVLAGIHFSERMPTNDWLGILGDKRNDRYTVRPGDSLWEISSRTVGSPKQWRKLWAMNPELTNPHDLIVGQVLSYYREGLDSGGFEIPIVKLVPNRRGAGTDLDSDSVVNLELKNQYRPSFFVISEGEIRGSITGAYVERPGLTQHSDIYGGFVSPELANPGTSYSVVRVLKEVRDHTSPGHPVLGLLVRLVGEVKTQLSGDSHTKLDLTRQMEIVGRGDKLVDVRKAVKNAPTLNPPEDMVARVVMGDNPDVSYFAQGQIVLLNKGTKGGIKDGYLFRVLVDTDPYLKSSAEVNPDHKGEIQVISSGELSSVGIILRNTSPILVGDTLVAAQLFPERAPVPRREAKEIEFN